MNPPRWALIATAAFLLVGCGSDAGAQERWPGPPRPSADGQVEASGFNDFLDEERPPAGESALSTAAEFLRLDRSNAGTTSLVSRVGGEGAGPATVVATLDRLPDDSVRAERYVVVLDRQDDGTWRLRSAVRTQGCWPGRGHQDFSVEPCV